MALSKYGSEEGGLGFVPGSHLLRREATAGETATMQAAGECVPVESPSSRFGAPRTVLGAKIKKYFLSQIHMENSPGAQFTCLGGNNIPGAPDCERRWSVRLAA